MKQIPLSNGEFALVDDEDFDFISRWKWWKNENGYAFRSCHKGNGKSGTVLMHRLICAPVDGLEVDHINRNKLDNRRSNLRSVTRSQNERNKSLRSDNTSGYKGVHWDKSHKKWYAGIRHDGKRIYLGRFATAEEASRAYDAYVHEHQLGLVKNV